MRETLYGIVEIVHNDDREAVVKSCLCGLVSHIYVRYYDKYCSENRNEAQLDKSSCIPSNSPFIVGIPKTIEFKNRYGCSNLLRLVSFASKIDVNTLFELAKDRVKEETSLRYSRNMDAVEITIKRSFAGFIVDTEINYDNNHPKYSELKAAYEEEMRSYSSFPDYNSAYKQEFVVIDGRQFKVYYSPYSNLGTVYLDNETLFTTKVKEVFLDSGEKVNFCSETLFNRGETNIIALRNSVETNRIYKIHERKRREYELLKVSSIWDIITNAGKIGKIELTMNNGGYGDIPIFEYGYIVLKRKTVTFRIGDDEEIAKSNTLEALQYLFLQEIKKRYSEIKFSHQAGKKRKVLTESETEAKKDFDSLVREVTSSLTIENVLENLEFLEEYYQELMK